MKKIFFAFLCFSLCCFGLISKANAGEGPIQVSGVDAEFGTLEWDANTEPDLAGYNVYYSLGAVFNYLDNMDDCTIGCIPVGNVTTFSTLLNPDPMYQLLIGGGISISYGVAALDVADNRSGVTYKNDSDEYVTENFTEDQPPANPGGVNLSE